MGEIRGDWGKVGWNQRKSGESNKNEEENMKNLVNWGNKFQLGEIRDIFSENQEKLVKFWEN